MRRQATKKGSGRKTRTMVGWVSIGDLEAKRGAGGDVEVRVKGEEKACLFFNKKGIEVLLAMVTSHDRQNCSDADLDRQRAEKFVVEYLSDTPWFATIRPVCLTYLREMVERQKRMFGQVTREALAAFIESWLLSDSIASGPIFNEYGKTGLPTIKRAKKRSASHIGGTR